MIFQGDTGSTKYQVDLGDGVRAIYQNLTVTDEPIQHRYERLGVYRVTVKAENMAGHDQDTIFIQVTGQPHFSGEGCYRAEYWNPTVSLAGSVMFV